MSAGLVEHDNTDNAAVHRATAQRLRRAYERREATDPVIDGHPHLGVDDAYAIQKQQVAGWIESGDEIVGYKVGLTSRAMQIQTGVDQPDYGHLMRSMFELEHFPISATRFIQPRIEPEIAFILARPLSGPGVTMADAVRAIDCLLPAIEIIDSRIRDWQLTIVDTIADNASSGGVVLGGHPVSPRSIDLRLAGCVLHLNGGVVATGAGGAVLGSPLNSLVWLANALGSLGVTLEAGHVILSGAMTRAQSVRPGDTVSAHLAGLGSVGAVFAADTQEAA
ncbi:2-keto-4-pentenoate hydratase (plasmid) [Embleya sp. NBC_00888]|uniref:2-keto-4-pentenoate hydratase n=1 Tax=Embleya sp. NBC_00888 TaxID=2975960 RepID=UPI002F913CB6|nr:2-keto-4-pentenoate hydratase [Embleya sp. NBC_00888]